ncbi:MAG: tRNA 2-thiouridine(34) synthase MnmA [Deltaproteobacteria bacterium]|nr:tRNA 2-thiouridine(34) synthase MnmA [Deltaproteobacteria bacterium]
MSLRRAACQRPRPELERPVPKAYSARVKVAVLVSGGVDSSVALARLRREPGLELHAFYLRIWLEDELAYLGDCPWEEDLRHARSVTDQLGVPLEVVSLQTAYHERVVAHAVAELARGRTPSPDLHCNERVKFGAFMELVGAGFDRVATGHYARVSHADQVPSRLLAAADPVKDQTYFLARLTQGQLARVLFPIGDLAKAEVRAEARALGLSTQSRPDSQGICFLGKIPYPEFVRHHLGDRPGAIVDRDTGKTLGAHAGLWFHTIGQRKGMGLAGGPWFVVDKDPATQTLFVAHADRVHAHHRADFEVEDARWLGSPAPLPARLEVKLRHGPRRVGCTLSHALADRLRVTLDTPDPGVAPGQFAVFYDGAECLGSAVIA